jgi:hypothetical protein
VVKPIVATIAWEKTRKEQPCGKKSATYFAKIKKEGENRSFHPQKFEVLD